ncbi:hypothetical protein WA538_000395, partial [Blastocystis sp. DL]
MESTTTSRNSRYWWSRLVSFFFGVIIPISLCCFGFVTVLILMARSLHWTVWVASLSVGVYYGIRWLSRTIMYVSTSRLLNRMNLREETQWLFNTLSSISQDIISGVSQLRNGKSRGVLLLDSRRETLKDISRMLGNDLPLNKLPLLEAVNALVDALVNPTSLSPSQLQRIEERVAALEAAITTQLIVPPSPTNLATFLFHPRFWRNLWFYVSPTSPFFVTYPMIQRWLTLHNDAQVLHLLTPDKTHVTAILFEPAGEVTPRRQVILLASPNACVAELGYQNDPSVGFYTSRGYHVAVYNYRGAGDSEGVVSPENAVADAKLLVDTLAADFHLTLAAVHGTSIGGFVVASLQTRAFPIFDRNFASMDTLLAFFVPPPLPFLARVCRRWRMEVAATVDLKRPALLLFDPRDEMVVFPASLLATLTKRFYRAEEDAALRLAYRGGVAATRRLMTRLGLTTEDLRRGGEMTSEAVLRSHLLSNPRKLLLLAMHAEVLGFPLGDMMMEELEGKEGKEEFLVEYVTTWRRRVTNGVSCRFDVMRVLEVFGEEEFELEWEDASLRAIRQMLKIIQQFCDRENMLVPESFHVMSIHCSHNGILRRSEYAFIQSVLDQYISE